MPGTGDEPASTPKSALDTERAPNSPLIGRTQRLRMKILGLMGSPRVGGNTDLLIDACLKGAESSGAVPEKIIVDRLTIAPCREFYGCLKDGNCVIQDDMQGMYTKLLEADIVVVASPMFFYGLSGQLKILIDRCQALWARSSVFKQRPNNTGRKGVFIAVGATDLPP